LIATCVFCHPELDSGSLFANIENQKTLCLMNFKIRGQMVELPQNTPNKFHQISNFRAVYLIYIDPESSSG
jgi:hypothetical protein